MLPVSADILLVIATIVTILAMSSVVAGWTTRTWPIKAILSLLIAGALFGYVYMTASDGLEPIDIPNAFISVAARILN
jgi:uncharacterized membrane protein